MWHAVEVEVHSELLGLPLILGPLPLCNLENLFRSSINELLLCSILSTEFSLVRNIEIHPRPHKDRAAG